jgi:hypothetical protein
VRGLREVLFLLVAGLVVIAVVGDEVARVVRAMAFPLGGLLTAVVLARLVWFYTSRW